MCVLFSRRRLLNYYTNGRGKDPGASLTVNCKPYPGLRDGSLNGDVSFLLERQYARGQQGKTWSFGKPTPKPIAAVENSHFSGPNAQNEHCVVDRSVFSESAALDLDILENAGGSVSKTGSEERASLNSVFLNCSRIEDPKVKGRVGDSKMNLTPFSSPKQASLVQIDMGGKKSSVSEGGDFEIDDLDLDEILSAPAAEQSSKTHCQRDREGQPSMEGSLSLGRGNSPISNLTFPPPNHFVAAKSCSGKFC